MNDPRTKGCRARRFAARGTGTRHASPATTVGNIGVVKPIDSMVPAARAVTGRTQQADSVTNAARRTVADMTTTSSGSGPAVAADAVTLIAGTPSIGRQGVRFTVIGSAGTGVQLGLYAVISAVIGAQLASIASWFLSTLLTNAAHRAVTFDVHGSGGKRSDQIAAFLTCVVALGLTSFALTRLSDPDGVAGLIAIIAVNTFVGAGRFAGMRWWLGEAGQHTRSRLAAAARTAGMHVRHPGTGAAGR